MKLTVPGLVAGAGNTDAVSVTDAPDTIAPDGFAANVAPATVTLANGAAVATGVQGNATPCVMNELNEMKSVRAATVVPGGVPFAIGIEVEIPVQVPVMA